MKNHLSLVLGAIAIASPLTAFAAPFTNGSFEGSGFVDTDPANRPGWMTLIAGSTLIPGWTVVTAVDWQTTWIAPADGLKSVDLNDYSQGSIAQTFDTIPGQQYDVRFALCGNTYDLPAIKVLQVSAAGQSTQYQFDTTGHTPTSPGYIDTDFYFSANSTATTLLFAGLNGGAGGPVIDNVRVTAIPEPASLSMFALATVLMLRRTRRA